MPAHTDSTILNSRERKRRPEGHKIDELYKFFKYFERSTVKRIEENSNGLSRCLFKRYGQEKMRNKKLINRKKTHYTGMAVLLSLILPWKRKGEKSYYNTGYSYLVTHPSTISAEQDLTLLSTRKSNMLLSMWYIDSTVNAFFFLISKMRKGIKK